MKNKLSICKCSKCYWASQCGDNAEAACDDFTPLDTCQDVDTYEDDLRLRRDAYTEFSSDYRDSDANM